MKITDSTLVAYEPEEVTHIFFHTLTVDPDRAYKSSEGKGYNSNMATVEEFKKILQQLYDNNYCLVKLHDLADVRYLKSENQLRVNNSKIATSSIIEKLSHPFPGLGSLISFSQSCCQFSNSLNI